jgi:hypothetical protein
LTQHCRDVTEPTDGREGPAALDSLQTPRVNADLLGELSLRHPAFMPGGANPRPELGREDIVRAIHLPGRWPV